MIRSSINFKRLRFVNRFAYSTTSNNNSTGNPPSFFHNEENLPDKLDTSNSKIDLTAKSDTKEEGKKLPPKTHFDTEGFKTSSISAPKPLFSNDAGHILPPPPPVGSNSTAPLNSGSNGVSTVSTSHDTSNYFKSYKDFCKGMAYLGVGMGVIFFMFDQHERLDVSERQMQMMKKKQREAVTQMQTYKTKLNKIAIDNAKKNVITQGKMQMHVALLREQLIELGYDPVTIDKAVEKFESDVKIDVTGNTVNLWVPGESKLKSLIPDPHEYNKKK